MSEEKNKRDILIIKILLLLFVVIFIGCAVILGYLAAGLGHATRIEQAYPLMLILSVISLPTLIAVFCVGKRNLLLRFYVWLYIISHTILGYYTFGVTVIPALLALSVEPGIKKDKKDEKSNQNNV